MPAGRPERRKAPSASEVVTSSHGVPPSVVPRARTVTPKESPAPTTMTDPTIAPGSITSWTVWTTKAPFWKVMVLVCVT